MIRLILGLALTAASLAPMLQTACATSTHRPRVVVDGPTVHLSDIFSDTGAAGSAAIMETPTPGRRIVLDVYALGRLARRYDLAWRPQSKFAQTEIRRASRTVGAEEIEEALRRALATKGLSDDVNVELVNRGFNFSVIPTLAEPYVVRDAILNERTGRVSAVIAVASEKGVAALYQIAGQTYEVVDVPVLTRRVRRGEVIGKADVMWKKQRRAAVGRNILLDRNAIVGQAARRYLPEDRPLSTDDVEPPILVRKGALVTIYFRTTNMQLTAKARAVDDGARDQTIRVVNIRSKKTVEAVVRSPVAVVIPTGGLALD